MQQKGCGVPSVSKLVICMEELSLMANSANVWITPVQKYWTLG